MVNVSTNIFANMFTTDITDITDIILLNQHFQDCIQFFILLLTTSSIILADDSVFPYWIDKITKEYMIAPTKGYFILYSLSLTSFCLVGSCISILVFLIDISDFTLTIISIFSEILWACLSAAVILMLIDVIRIVRFLTPASKHVSI